MGPCKDNSAPRSMKGIYLGGVGSEVYSFVVVCQYFANTVSRQFEPVDSETTYHSSPSVYVSLAS